MDGLPLWLSTTLLGLGTVFVGLICLIFIIKLMGFVCGAAAKKSPLPAAAPAKLAATDAIENRQQFVAAVAAAIATVLGTDVTGLRITSIKKVK